MFMTNFVHFHNPDMSLILYLLYLYPSYPKPPALGKPHFPKSPVWNHAHFPNLCQLKLLKLIEILNKFTCLFIRLCKYIYRSVVYMHSLLALLGHYYSCSNVYLLCMTFFWFSDLYLHPALFIALETVTLLFVFGFALPCFKQKTSMFILTCISCCLVQSWRTSRT